MLTILHLSIYKIQKFQQSLFLLQSLFPFPFSISFGFITLMYISGHSKFFLTSYVPLAASRTARISFPDAQSVWNPRVGDTWMWNPVNSASSNINSIDLSQSSFHATYETIRIVIICQCNNNITYDSYNAVNGWHQFCWLLVLVWRLSFQAASAIKLSRPMGIVKSMEIDWNRKPAA